MDEQAAQKYPKKCFRSHYSAATGARTASSANPARTIACGKPKRDCSNPVYSVRMRTPSRHLRVHRVVLTAAVLCVAVGTLSGCKAAPDPDTSDMQAPAVEDTPTPTETPPLFASNDEALAAAKAAYTKYLSAGDAAGATGSDSWNQYMALMTGTEHKDAVEARQLMDDRGWSFTGITLFDSMSVQSSQELTDSTWEVRTYLCLDLSATGTVNLAGESVVKPDRPLRVPMVVVFIAPDENSQQLLISESPVWSGSNFCS